MPQAGALFTSGGNTATFTAATLADVLARPHGFLNRLINGDFRINQRAFASGATLAAGAYAHDRWKAGASGCTYSFSQTAGVTQVSITAGSLLQTIDAPNIEGGAYTLSWSGTATARVYQGGASGTYAASPIVVSGLSAATQTTVEFAGGTLMRAQLEPGSLPSPFEQRFIEIETTLCLRYYWISSALGTGFGPGQNKTGTVVVQFPTQMRMTPTVAILNGNVNNGSLLEIYSQQRVISGFGSGSVLSPNGGRFDIQIATALNSTPQFCISEAGTFGFNAEI